MKRLTVTVGIPAYNEEANIENLLVSVCSQKEDGFVINKITVVSDCSTDETVSRVKRVKDKRIKLIRNRSRQGQAYCQNKIFSLADTDIVVLFEADTYPASPDYLKQLIELFQYDKAVGLIQGLPSPLPPQTFIEKVFVAQVIAYQKFIDSSSNSPSQGGRAFNKRVYSKLRWPKAVPEDRFAIFWCKQNRIKTLLQKKAVSLYRCPQHFSDYVIKQQKVRSGLIVLKTYSPGRFVKASPGKTRFTMIKMAGYFLIHNPLYFLAYVIFRLELHKRLRETKFTDFWPAAQTTKNLAGNL